MMMPQQQLSLEPSTEQQVSLEPSTDLSSTTDVALMMIERLSGRPSANIESPVSTSVLPLGMLDYNPDDDFLLAMSGYHVKASKLEHIAQELQQLDSALSAAQGARVPADFSCYNPSDIEGWLHCLKGELTGALPSGNPPEAVSDAKCASIARTCGLDVPNINGNFPCVTAVDIILPHKQDTVSQAMGPPVEQPVAPNVESEKRPSCSPGDDEIASTSLLSSKADSAYIVVDDNDETNGNIVPMVSTSCAPLESTKLKRTYIAIDNDDMTLKAPLPSLCPQFNRGNDMTRRNQVALSACGGTGHTHAHTFGVDGEEDQVVWKTNKDSTSQYAAVKKCPRLTPNVDDAVRFQMKAVEGAEDGIHLVHLLMACADAAQRPSMFPAALEMVEEIERLACIQKGSMGKVALYFADGLKRRIKGINSDSWTAVTQARAKWLMQLYTGFYEACPYLQFAHFTANQAILEAFEGHDTVHIIDLNLMDGVQWPTLIQALAQRPGGPPVLRLTGVGPPQPDNEDALREMGSWLAQLAEHFKVKFKFCGIVAAKLNDVKPSMFGLESHEAVAVNSIFQLHRLLYVDPNSNAAAPIDVVLHSIKSLNPRIVTVVEQEASHNSQVVIERFTQALHYYCTMFDSLEGCRPDSELLKCAEKYLGMEIVNIVASEGLSRTERHEKLPVWRLRMSRAGFRPLHLGSNTYKQASMLVRHGYGEGYTVEENYGCLMLGWHSRPLIASSAWHCG